MKKILVFGMTDKAGGVESVIMNYYRNIDRAKINFDFLCNNEVVAYEDEIKELGGNIYKITARSKDIKKYKQDMKEFFKKHSNDYSTIWVNVCSLANIDYLKYAKKYGIKYRIIHSHNSQNMDSKLRGILHKINRILIKKYATDFWTCSKEAGEWFYNKKIINNEKYLLVNNAIDTNKFKFNEEIRSEVRKELEVENKLVIGHVGRFHFQKNHTFLIDIFKKVSEKNKDAHMVLVGIGTLEDEIKKKVEDLNLKNKVTFLGQRKDVDKIMQAFDVLLFPSLFEGLPLTLIEAQANGMPILASKDVIPKEVKMSDNFTFVSLEDNSEKWADILLSQDLTNKSKENIEKIKKRGFDIQEETKKITKYFERD